MRTYKKLKISTLEVFSLHEQLDLKNKSSSNAVQF